jgi:uncharacterized membrane protein
MAMAPALMLHIGAGVLGIVSGGIALAARKGGRLHRRSGIVFIAAMLVMTSLAVWLAAIVLQKDYSGSVVLIAYLLATGWMTVRRRPGEIGRFEKGAVVLLFALFALDLLLAGLAASSTTGRLGGYPPGHYLFGALIVGLLARADLKLVRNGGIAGAPRLRRHIWRMCVALFVATGSFFIGQQKVMPAFVQGSPILFALGFAPLILMVFWLVRVGNRKWLNPVLGRTAPAES